MARVGTMEMQEGPQESRSFLQYLAGCRAESESDAESEGGYTGIARDLEMHAPKPNTSLALKANTYDAVTLAQTKVYDLATVKEKGKGNLWISFIIAFVMHAIAMCLQVLLIFMLVQFTIERREDKFETIDLVLDTKNLMQAVSNGTALDKVTYAKVLSLCGADHNVPYSQSVMTWLWGMKLIPLIAASLWNLVVLSRLPHPEDDQGLITIDKDKVNITHYTAGMKLTSLLMVQFPRILVAIYLYCMGAKFLMYAPSLGFLIIKSVGLAFISTIPDILSQGIFSEAFQKDLGRAQLSFHSTPNVHWNLWGSSLAKFSLVLGVTLFYCRIMCADLQAFRAACNTYEYHFVEPECSPNCGSHMFGFTFYN